MKPISTTVELLVDVMSGSNHHHSESFRDMVTLSGGNRLLLLIMLVVYLLLILMIGKWLWNNVLCRTITIAKPMPNVLTLLGLVILLELILPC
jgi:uncharacterized membrane protein (DUF485 family)